MKRLPVLAMLAAGCGSGGGDGAGASFVAATIDGVAWRVSGQGSVLTTAAGEPNLTILGYTPLPGSKQSDTTKPQLEILFSGIVPAAGAYDVATTSYLTLMYMPDRATLYGGETGNVTITAITADAAAGTFTAVATAPGITQSLTITDGSFHVPIGRL